MGKHDRLHLQKLNSGDNVLNASWAHRTTDVPNELRRYLSALGPVPRSGLQAFVDLGLSDDEIARYFHVPENCITQFCDVWNIRQ